MNLEFLAFANFWLLGRLVCFLRDDTPPARMWRIKGGLEIIVLGVLFPCGLAWGGTVLTVLALNLGGFLLERRVRHRDFFRLVLGGIGLLAWSFWLSPRLGLTFRPELAEWSARLARWTALAPVVPALGSAKAQLVLLGLLFSANESNLAIRSVFEWLKLKPANDIVDAGEFNRGRIIGMLERLLLYSFVLQAQYSAIGFILAAKAFTRFKDLDKRSFAEYVLIGTLLSACLALGVGGAIRWFLAH